MRDFGYEACRILQAVLRARAPYDTGNLAHNAIRIDYDHLTVVVGGEAAPYAPYTNEPWEARAGRRGKNPNEGWIPRAIEEALPLIRRTLDGTITEAELEESYRHYEKIFCATQQRRAEEIRDELLAIEEKL